MSEIHELLAARWSPRAFATRMVEAEKLELLFEAARWSASCYNDQPWYFVLARRDQDLLYQQLLECLLPANQAWAATAPLLLMTVAGETFRHNGQRNRHAWFDTGLAVGNLLCQATALGLVAHQMAGFDVDGARRCCGLPSGFDPIAVMALGYLGDPSALPSGVDEKVRDQRERRPLTQFVFAGGWDQTGPTCWINRELTQSLPRVV